MPNNGKLFNGWENRTSYEALRIRLWNAVPKEKFLAIMRLYWAFRYGRPITRESKDGGPRIIPRRVSFHGAYFDRWDLDLLQRTLPVNIVNERTGKKYRPRMKVPIDEPPSRSWRMRDLYFDLYERPWPYNASDCSLDLTDELGEMVGPDLVSNMWDHLLRYSQFNEKLVEQARADSGLWTRAMWRKEQKARSADRNPPRGRNRVMTSREFDEMMGIRTRGRRRDY